MTDAFASWSLAELKSVTAAVDPTTLDHDASTLRTGARRLGAVVLQFDSALATLDDDWTGTAARAAATNARATIGTVNTTSAIAADVNSSVTGYADAVRRTQHEVAAIPDEHFSWGRALADGGWAGPMGIGVAAFGQHQDAERHRAHALELVAGLDAEGHAHAETTRGQPWAMGFDESEPPTPLPATDIDHASHPRTSQPVTAPSQSGAAGRRDESSSAHSDTGHYEATPAPAARRQHYAHKSVGEHTPSDGHPPPVAAATLPAVAGARDTHHDTHHDTHGAARADVGALADPSGAGTTSAAASERPAGEVTMAGLGEHVVLGARGEDSSSGIPPTAGPTPVGRAREAIVHGRPAPLPAAPRPPGPAPGYPVGGSGQRRDDEDEIRERPEYLIEPDDIWGHGRPAVPPVLG